MHIDNSPAHDPPAVSALSPSSTTFSSAPAMSSSGSASPEGFASPAASSSGTSPSAGGSAEAELPPPREGQVESDEATGETQDETTGEAPDSADAAPPAKARQRYPSDLSDPQWLRVEPLVERPRSRGRKPEVSLREIVNALHYRWTTNCAWRMLPHDFPPWNTVYFYYRDWREKGVLPQLRAMLIERPTVLEICEQERQARLKQRQCG